MGVKRKINEDNNESGARVRISGNLNDSEEATVEQAQALCHLSKMWQGGE